MGFWPSFLVFKPLEATDLNSLFVPVVTPSSTLPNWPKWNMKSWKRRANMFQIVTPVSGWNFHQRSFSSWSPLAARNSHCTCETYSGNSSTWKGSSKPHPFEQNPLHFLPSSPPSLFLGALEQILSTWTTRSRERMEWIVLSEWQPRERIYSGARICVAEVIKMSFLSSPFLRNCFKQILTMVLQLRALCWILYGWRGEMDGRKN